MGRASLSAAATLQPLEMPQKMPSSAASRARRRHALLGGGGDHPGELRDVEVARHEAVADALDAVVSPLAAGQERALRRLDGVKPHAR